VLVARTDDLMCGMGRSGQGRVVTERAAAAESQAGMRSTWRAPFTWLAKEACQHGRGGGIEAVCREVLWMQGARTRQAAGEPGRVGALVPSSLCARTTTGAAVAPGVPFNSRICDATGAARVCRAELPKKALTQPAGAHARGRGHPGMLHR
jgi:hypothetical protein